MRVNQPDLRGCRRVLDLLDDYLHEALSPRAQAAVQTHLARCPRCAAEFRAARALLSRLPADTATTAPAAARLRILAGVAQRRRAQTARAFPLGRFARGAVFTTVGAAAAVTVVLLVLPRSTGPGASGGGPASSANVTPAPPRPGAVNPPAAQPGAPPLPNPAPPVVAPPATERRLTPTVVPPGTRGSTAPRDRTGEPENDPANEPDAASPASDPEAIVAPTPAGLDDATVVPLPEG